MDHAFLHNTGNRDAKVTFLAMVDNSSGSMVATAVQKKGHDKFLKRFLLKGRRTKKRDGSMWQNTWQLKERATTIVRQTLKKSSQSKASVERAHQSVEAMVRTMKEATEGKAQTKLSATETRLE